MTEFLYTWAACMTFAVIVLAAVLILERLDQK